MKTTARLRSFLAIASSLRLAFPLASGIAALFSAPAAHAANLYWNTDGTGALLTAANWASSSSGPFTTAWANGSDIFFTANSAITYVTTTDVGNLTITGASTVTLTAAGTYTTGGAVRTFDIGTGSTLVWNGQDISTAAGTGFIKNGAGTWNLGAQGNLFPGGLTINAGTIIAGGVNALGGGALNFNGGTIHANSGTARDYSGKLTGIAIGGDFALGDATNNGALTFNAATNLGAADRTITLYSAATFNGIISGDSGVGLKKAGVGTLTLSGTAVNTFDGGLDVNGGTLALSFANFASGWTDIVNSGNALTFGGGLLTITGENSANNTTQSFAGVTVNAGGGSLLVNPNGAGVSNGTTVNLNSLGTLSSWAAGSSLVLGKALPTVGTGTVTLTTTTDKDATTGIYGGRIVFADGTASTGYDWATTSTVSSPYTLEAYTGYDPTLPTNTGSSTTNYGIAAGITLDGNLAANTLKITGSATPLALGANTLTLKSGGLLSVGSTAQTISGTAGGTRLTAGSGNGGSEDLVIHQYNSGNTNAGLTISAVIGDNTAGSGNIVNLVKAGITNLVLQGVNTYTGNTFINAGTLILGAPGNASTAGSLGSGTYAGNISIASGAQLAFRSNSNQTFSGVISGDGSLFKGGAGTLTLSNDNTYTGATQVAGLGNGNPSGIFNVSSFNSIFTNPALGTVRTANSSLGAPTTVANGTITIGNGLQASASLTYTGPGETTDRVISLAFGNRDLFLNASGSGLLKFVSAFKSSGATGIFTLGGTGAGEIAGSLPQLATTTGGLKKTDAGIWTLSGTNLYTLGTSVTAGTLSFRKQVSLYNNDQTSWTPAKISVDSGATLALGVGDSASGYFDATALDTFLDGTHMGASTTTSGFKTGALLGFDTTNATLGSFTYNSNIGNFGTALTNGIVKLGTGTLELGGTNTYTGTTTVSAGKLFIQGDSSLATGNVSVSGGASLGGKGTLGGNVSVADTGKLEFNLSTPFGSHDKLELAAGKTLTFVGASTLTLTSTSGASTGLYTLVTAPGGISGSLPAVTLPGGWSADPPQITGVGNTDLVINITSTGGGGDVTPPTLTSITDNVSGGPITEDASVTYTVTFSEDIDSATVTTTDFDNQGTASLTINSVVETGPTTGVFTVVATPTTPGTLRLRIPSGAVIADTAALPLVVPVSDDTTITVRSKYEAWSGATDFNTDTNGDGVKNGLAFLLGAANKNVSALSLLPTVTQSSGNLVLTFSMLNAANRKAAALSVQHSSDLGIGDAWASALVPNTTQVVSGVTFTITGVSPINVVANIPAANAAGGKLFGRLLGNQ